MLWCWVVLWIASHSRLCINGPSEPGRLRDVCVCLWVNDAVSFWDCIGSVADVGLLVLFGGLQRTSSFITSWAGRSDRQRCCTNVALRCGALSYPTTFPRALSLPALPCSLPPHFGENQGLMKPHSRFFPALGLILACLLLATFSCGVYFWCTSTS